MSFEILSKHLNGIIVLRTARFEDHRGFFEELYRVDALWKLGVEEVFVQDNRSNSHRNVIRGLHYQFRPPMGKLIRVVAGSAQFIELDIRKDSPTFGRHVEIELSDSNNKLLWVPPGFANGFCALTDTVDVIYKCTAIYNPLGEGSINPLDPALGIKWFVTDAILSERDAKAPPLSEIKYSL
ncbi:MAG: dTDP-4-dehydrorhamnose 3,5-epimerase [Ignavibacteria bacterium]|nr:dTDP-4-dehydrorhamnose 3,5-epimerase [Ignavibacteria bacterium]